MNQLASTCSEIAINVAAYLNKYIEDNKGFNLRSFYGESFTLNLLFRVNMLDPKIKDILINEYLRKDKNDPEFHYEFNNYAFSDYCALSKDAVVHKLYFPLKFKETQCTNWTLLRSNVRIRENFDVQFAWDEIFGKLNSYQLKNGLILDDPGVKSFQYHCFSAAMLIEIYEKTKKEELLISFKAAVNFIRKFILKNGEALYIGRGQEQSFGLGVLVFILSKYYEYSLDENVLEEIAVILNFLKSFQRTDGSFPLVFTGLEKTIPANVDMHAEEFCGWYPYNNFFDYLPFFGYFIQKASDVLVKYHYLAKNDYKNSKSDYFDKYFIVKHETSYSAIVSLPGGYWTNDMPIPLISYRNEFVTPLLGGEQFQKSLYNWEALSLPVTKVGRFSWRKWGKGLLFKHGIIWFSPFGVLIRHYTFLENKIEVINYGINFIPSVQLISMLAKYEKINDNIFEIPGVKLILSKPCKKVLKGFSTSGRLKVLEMPFHSKITVELL